MRAIELEESVFKYSIRNTAWVKFYSSKRTHVPSLIVVSLSGDITDNDSEWIIYRVKVNTLMKAYRKGKIDHSTIGTIMNVDPSMNEYPQYVEVMNFENKSKLFKALTTKFSMPVSIFEQFFGKAEIDDDDDDVIVYNKIRLHFPETMRKKSREESLNFIKTVEKHLQSKGFHELMEGDIRFIKLPGKTIGMYYTDSDTMAIQPTAKSDSQNLLTLIHEYGHRYMRKFASGEIQSTIMKKFDQLKKNGEQYQDVLSTARDEYYNSLSENLVVGTRIQYVGRKKDYKRMAPDGWFIVTLRKDNRVKIAPDNDLSIYGGLSGSVGAFGGKDWVIPNVQYNDRLQNSIGSSDHSFENGVDQWFPTAYSQKDWEEWFCESFSFWCTDKYNNKEVQAFWDKLMGK